MNTFYGRYPWRSTAKDVEDEDRSQWPVIDQALWSSVLADYRLQATRLPDYRFSSLTFPPVSPIIVPRWMARQTAPRGTRGDWEADWRVWMAREKRKSGSFVSFDPESPLPTQGRWPDLHVQQIFEAYRQRYQELFRVRLRRSANQINSANQGFCDLCEEILEEWKDRCRSGASGGRAKLEICRIERIASALGMLAHLEPDRKHYGCVVNLRRPWNRLPTYPTPPWVGRTCAEFCLDRLIPSDLPATCRSVRAAERFAKRSLAFRLIDPSMESAHLLLQVAIALVSRVCPSPRSATRSEGYLTRALLERLLGECLWGIDKSAKSVSAANTVMSLFALLCGATGCETPHLVVGDSLKLLGRNEWSEFDCLVNNPPWGSSVDGNVRDTMKRFPTLYGHPDAYVVFTEAGLGSLRAGGVFGFILPSQVLGARNAVRIRHYLCSKGRISALVLLPRSAFAPATVRGVLVLGHREPATSHHQMCIVRFPVLKDMSRRGPIERFQQPVSKLNESGETSWVPLIWDGRRNPASSVEMVRLGELAHLVSGVKTYAVGQGRPPQTADTLKDRPFTCSSPKEGAVPALRGRNVVPFAIARPELFVRLGAWLAWVGPHESLRFAERVFVRELCRRDGRLFAAPAPKGTIPLRSIVTVLPLKITVNLLLAVLNSGPIAEHVKSHTASFTKVDFQKITVRELAEIPIPRFLTEVDDRRGQARDSLRRNEMRLRQRLTAAVTQIRAANSLGSGNSARVWTRLENLVRTAYGIAEDARAL